MKKNQLKMNKNQQKRLAKIKEEFQEIILKSLEDSLNKMKQKDSEDGKQ